MESRLKDILRSDWGFVALCLLAGVAARALHIADFAQSPVFQFAVGPDTSEYDQLAKAILGGQLLWSEPGIHAPLYPYFLAGLYKLFSCDMALVRFAQTLLGLLAGIPVFLALRDAVAKSPAALRFAPKLFMAFWALFPIAIQYQSELYSEALALPLLICSAWLLHEAEKSVKPNQKLALVAGGGLLAGLAAIAHSLALLFLALELAWIAFSSFKSRSLKAALPAALLLFCALLPIVPVCVRNSQLSGRLAFIQANGGFNFYLGNNAGASGTCDIRPGPEWDACHADADAKASKLGVSKDCVFLKAALSWMAAHPLDWLALTVEKSLYAINFRELPTSAELFSTPGGGTFIERNLRWLFGPLAVFALLGLFLEARRRGYGALPGFKHFLLLALAFWLAQTFFVAGGRYRMPMHPALLALAACALLSIMLERRSKKELLLLETALGAAALLAFAPNPRLDAPRLRAEADSVLAEACADANEPQKALERLQASERILSQWDRTCNLKGRLLEELGRPQEAAQCYLDAATRFPNSRYAFMNLGAMASSQGDFQTAGRFFAKALSLKNDDAELLYNVGLFEQRQGNLKKAIELYRRCVALNPAFKMALNNLGAALLVSGAAQEAEAFFKRALALEPSNFKTLVNLAAAKLALRKKAEAKRLLEKALALNPGDSAAETLLKQASK